MSTHQERLIAAREAIRYICARSRAEMARSVPNCPGWSVYNAAVHIGRVGVAWESMISAPPTDPESRTRGYADAESRGSGHEPVELASWAISAIDALEGDVDRPCYFSMTGGHGTVGLWGWHAASELGVHRLDVEHALGVPYAMSDDLAADAIDYTARFFLPAMARVTEVDPGPLDVIGRREGEVVVSVEVRSPGNEAAAAATLSGAPVDILLALWGRSHGPVEIDGEAAVVDRWHALPATAFQFGTWGLTDRACHPSCER